jgi:hypothetical protein
MDVLYLYLADKIVHVYIVPLSGVNVCSLSPCVRFDNFELSHFIYLPIRSEKLSHVYIIINIFSSYVYLF